MLFSPLEKKFHPKLAGRKCKSAHGREFLATEHSSAIICDPEINEREMSREIQLNLEWLKTYSG